MNTHLSSVCSFIGVFIISHPVGLFVSVWLEMPGCLFLLKQLDEEEEEDETKTVTDL